MVGVPALITETFSCSYPKHHRARTHKPEVNKHIGESTIRRDMPAGLVEAVDRMDAAGRRQTLRSISRAAEASGFEAACGAALRVVEGGRVPDDATVDVLARRIAAGGAEAAGGADLGVYDGFLKGGARHAG